ncbi:uncharacterized protein LOC112010702 [Quercus suber]|uniref:uncharacterized protein LOC112010702 n=1 Tax=Quercus suber TaxID=58331 RepID=UPI0032DF630B
MVQMAIEIRFDFTIHHSGNFEWNPGLEYVGGEVSTMANVDPDLLSHFEIQDICAEARGPINSRIYYLIPGGDLEQGLRLITSDEDVTYMCELHVEWPTNEITLYVEPEVEPIAIEKPIAELDQPIAVDQSWEMNDEDNDTDDDTDEDPDCKEVTNTVRESVVDQNDVSEEPVEGLRDGSVGGDVEDFHVDEPDWLEEGYEGPDYLDDIFGAENNEVPNMREHESDSENVNEGDGVREQVTDDGKRPEVVASDKAAASDQAGDNNDWAEKALDDDDARSVDSSEDEDERVAYPEFNENTGMSNPQLCKGMKFPNVKVFRAALREYAVRKSVDIKFKLNENTKVSVYCKYDCGWRVYISQIAGELTFQIKTIVRTCTCGRTFKHSQVTSTYVARKYLEDFNKNPDWEVFGVKHRVMQDVNVDLSINQVYRAKRKAREFILGDERLQYGKLRDYAEMIRVTDVGSKVILQTEITEPNTQPKFKRMYVRYNAQKVGFLEGCRPFVGLDGCHLKGKFGGQILSAIGRDGNDNIFPVTLEDIGRPDELNLVFISDRQKGLIPAMEMLFPTMEHRFCVKHIYNNFKLTFKGLELKAALWRCAAATTVREFEKRMQELKELDREAWEYVADIQPTQWTKSHFTPRAIPDCYVNNLSESFNSMILEATDKPIIAMLEWIRVRLMTRMYSKRTGIEKFTSDLCPNIVQKLEQLKVDSKPFFAIPLACYIYEVDNEYERYVVNLSRKSCTCRVCDLTGIPCKHGVAAIYKNLERPENYVHACFRKDAYVAAYKEMITPLPGQDEWVETSQPAPVAPIVYKPPGRPPMKRKKDADEPNISRSYRPIKCRFYH